MVIVPHFVLIFFYPWFFQYLNENINQGHFTSKFCNQFEIWILKAKPLTSKDWKLSQTFFSFFMGYLLHGRNSDVQVVLRTGKMHRTLPHLQWLSLSLTISMSLFFHISHGDVGTAARYSPPYLRKYPQKKKVLYTQTR